MKAYKLFRTLASRPGEIFPLFISKSDPVDIGVWLAAEFIPTEGFAHRPGWHVTLKRSAPHLSMEGRVWAEVEIPDDDNGWQAKADKSPTRDIRGRVPTHGFYRFQRPSNQGGEWLIAGEMKVVRILGRRIR